MKSIFKVALILVFSFIYFNAFSFSCGDNETKYSITKTVNDSSKEITVSYNLSHCSHFNKAKDCGSISMTINPGETNSTELKMCTIKGTGFDPPPQMKLKLTFSSGSNILGSCDIYFLPEASWASHDNVRTNCKGPYGPISVTVPTCSGCKSTSITIYNSN